MHRVILLGLLLTPNAHGFGQMETHIADEPVIWKIVTDQVAAWNKGDGVAWAQDFSEDADFINIRGDVFQGKAEITKRHEMILSAFFKGTHIGIKVRKTTFLSNTVALIETDQVVTGFKKLAPVIAATSPGTLVTHMKYVMVSLAGNWKIVAVQNSAVLPGLRCSLMSQQNK